MKICMTAGFDVKSPLSWSGTPLSLYNALSSYEENEISTLNLSQYHTDTNLKMNALKTCNISSSIKSHSLISKLGPSAMNPLNSKLLKKYCPRDCDVLFEFGGFKTHSSLPPYYIYTDSSQDMKLDYLEKYGRFPFNAEKDDINAVKRAADYIRPIYQNAAGIFCMSEWIAEIMVRVSGVKKEKIHVVYAGANHHSAALPNDIKPKRIDCKKKFNLLLTGVNYRGKGVDIAVDAVRKLNESADGEFFLHVCGIKKDFCDDEHIINHGFVGKDRLFEILRQTDLFVLPSRFDCFGISFVEAMEFGIPCIGRNICAMPEIIDEGENGELITSDDPTELAELILKILSDEKLYAAYSESALKKAKRFTWETVSSDIMKILNK